MNYIEPAHQNITSRLYESINSQLAQYHRHSIRLAIVDHDYMATSLAV